MRKRRSKEAEKTAEILLILILLSLFSRWFIQGVIVGVYDENFKYFDICKHIIVHTILIGKPAPQRWNKHSICICHIRYGFDGFMYIPSNMLSDDHNKVKTLKLLAVPIKDADLLMTKMPSAPPHTHTVTGYISRAYFRPKHFVLVPFPLISFLFLFAIIVIYFSV